MIDSILEHLEALVGADTTNPPRAITRDNAVIEYVASVLQGAGCTVQIDDLGEGSINIFAYRGTPTILINCHLDTVPATDSWSQNPHALTVNNNRATGLGTCDIKGAAACILTAIQNSDADVAVLFTTDEEAGKSRCVTTFCKANNASFDAVIVSEPTNCTAVTAHRGLISAEATFTGTSAHASSTTSNSATHHLTQWAASVLADDQLTPHRFNLGVITGGKKPNMIASSATARFGLRPAPGSKPNELLETIKDHLPDSAIAEWTTRFTGAPLNQSDASLHLAHRLGLPLSPPVDFWTEAAIFAHHNIPAIVFGPGNIAQAHTADEWIALDQLTRAALQYTNIFTTAHQPVTS